MASSTRALVASPTRPPPLSTFETVCLPTPAALATSSIVTRRKAADLAWPDRNPVTASPHSSDESA